MNLAKEISFLLYKHNCVILPGFGAFLLRDKPAERNEIAKYALPKQRVVTFNKQIENNDGLVANYISTEHQCTYERGLEKIEEYTQSLWEVLKTKRNVEVAEIGTFYYTQENKLVFVPYHSVNFDTTSFGLPKLRLKSLENVNTTLVPNIEKKSADIEQQATVEKRVIEIHSKEPQSKPELPKVKEVVKKVALASAKTKTRNEKLQNKKLDKKAKSSAEKSRFSGLALVNTLGVCFLIGITFALINFEKNQSTQESTDQQIASLLDTPQTIDKKQTKSAPSFGIYAEVKNNDGAIELTESLLEKYENASITLDTEGTTSVFIISFGNEDLANEYKNLLQNKLDQKLVIRQK